MEFQYRRVPVCDLVIPMYKQSPITNRIKYLAENFDIHLFTEPKVSYRDGKYYIMDGVHTMLAMKLRGIKEIPCKVFSGMTFEDEASLFYGETHGRRITRKDIERARKALEDAKAKN